ncbi:di-heme oxidoredictase family protein [Corallococcus exercitus]|uniref:di-heme oxidoredictase family protein n=1 Tax=Corallococcus exercitus TaxID=2316736 RepID=UPI0013152583|nr:di-heme oxidoredictase family protein [Corallococcus exercitus]
MRALCVGLMLSIIGCSKGDVVESPELEAQRDLLGIATPGDPSRLQPVELHPRAGFGAAPDYESLGYPNASPEVMALLDSTSPDSPLHFFITPHTDAEGVGPLFNQRACLGCHTNSEDVRSNIEQGGIVVSPPADFTLTNTPASRAARQGNTDHSKITKETGNPPTAAFTLYGNYSPGTGSFDPIASLGGPLQHVQSVGMCRINDLPSLARDPSLQGGLDPVTGLSPLGLRREVGERAAPPYIGRGLMEAILADDIVANDDLADKLAFTSSLSPPPDPAICPGDCISGRHNENRADLSFVGGDPRMRVSRFGLRAAGPTLLQFVVGGLQGELGLTSPFMPTEQPNVDNAGNTCDAVPDPELKTDVALRLRDLIRNIAPPMHDASLYETPPVSQTAIDVQAGARLFGVDLAAFQSRMIPGREPVGFGDPDADKGIAGDRMLGCVTCHIPIMKTGTSPAKLGAEHLSNRWAPIFSDLLIHQNPELPKGIRSRLRPSIPGNINRDLTDFAIPPAVTGIGNGAEFRTPPLMGLGKVGPPFWHDGRVYLNVIGARSYPGDPPTPPASTVFTSADEGTRTLSITSVELAVLAAIELHDLPAPPGNDYAQCPTVAEGMDFCSRQSRYRGEARNVMEKFRALTTAQQLQVVRFLLAL